MSSIAKFDVEKFDGSNDFGLWRVKMRCLLIQHSWEAALDPFPGTMTDDDETAALKTDVNKKAHSVLLLCLDNKVLREVNKEDSTAGVWLKLGTLYMTKSLANKLYLKNKLFTFYMHSCKKLPEHIDGFNKMIGDLANIDVDIDEEDQALMLLTSLPPSYDNFVETLLYERESLTLEDVLSSLNSHELKKRIDAKDDGDGLYVRGRLDHWGNQGRGSSRSQSKGTRKKSTSFVKKNAGQGSGMHSESYENGNLLMAEFNGGTVLLGDNRAYAILGIRKVRVQMKDGSSFVLENVRYIPELKRNLIFLGTLDREGYTMKLQNGRVKVVKGFLMVLSGTMKGNYVYSLDYWAESGEASVEVLGNKGLGKLEFCENCVLGKSTRGPSRVESMSCYRYFLSIVDDYSRRDWVHFLRHENEAFNEFRKWKQLVENQTGRKLKKLRTDNGLEFCNQEFNNLCKDEWVRALEEEMSSLKKNHTWELVDQPPGQKLVSGKWLYKIKEGIEGVQKTRYKARLVARGTQRVGIDYNEVFSPVVRHTSIRVMLSLTACEDYELEQLDVKTAFLHAMGLAATATIVAFTSKSLHQGLLRKEFDIKELGPARKILGMEIVRDRGLVYGRNQGKHVDIDGFVDADYAKHFDKEVVKESICLKGLLIELGVNLRSMVVNQSAIHLLRNAMFHEKTKHINVRYHFIREIVESKEIEVAKIGTEDNAADAFTKVIP
nr:retrovirus-related Pol polyprotein from transposon TNT 1-94 [Tanacetum cinerariifolium]